MYFRKYRDPDFNLTTCRENKLGDGLRYENNFAVHL